MSDAPYRRTDPKGAKAMIEEQGAIVVDVRTVGEFEAGHVPGSYNVPIAFGTPPDLEPNPDFERVVGKLFERDAKLVFV